MEYNLDHALLSCKFHNLNEFLQILEGNKASCIKSIKTRATRRLATAKTLTIALNVNANAAPAVVVSIASIASIASD